MVLQLKKYKTDIIPASLESKISQYKYAFNSSYLEHKGTKYMALRVFDDFTKTILALMFYWENESNIYELNLTHVLKNELGVFKVSDPKLFIMQDKVWGTFNTGHTRGGNNDIGIFQLEKNKVKSSFLCNYANRMTIEKNWSFFNENNVLYALYNVNPFTILKGEIVNSKQIEFRDYYIDDKTSFKKYSIGTPLVKSNDKYLFIGHYKLFLRKKMVYLGCPFHLKFGSKPVLIKGRLFLFHSIKSLFGSNKKFNVNLFSCTYFSGLFKENNKIYISYGINDVKWHIVSLIEKVLWP
ncbi:hypothetical protein E1J38_000565 [Seonamhaeicola sediminis]|uniref:Uncharacterized protein n=1 Tax=Seonamhaeicola sediminis TaxID=2528206 RepID=A0A562YHE9_9FLAO|nr:hypothetical protein [Seonamhaeicola sediminis]TWO34374.1 hypothetical protein E1J38_000565 [Seonamhaeicola sediminis]